MNRGNWAAPLCGVLFVVAAVVAFGLTGSGQDPAKKSAQEIASYYNDHDTKQAIGAVVIALAAVFLLFFAGWIRATLRAAGGEGGILPSVSFGALVVIATGLGVAATIHLALAQRADDIDPVALSAINAIDYDFFLPFVIGMSTFLLSSGISAVRSGALPTWLAWAAIVLGVGALAGPVGFFAFLLGLLWILIVGILGVLGGRGTAAMA